jgi:opacity protein-like surface antigen
MKSYRLFLVALFTLFYICSSAQIFAGGGLGLSTSGGAVKNGNVTTDKTSTLSFDLSPKIGKFFNEKVAAGAGMDLFFSRTKNPGNVDVITTSAGFGFAPFVRYYAVRFSKFSVFGEGTLDLLFSKSSTKTGNTNTDGPKTNAISIGIVPGLSYDLSEKFSLETSLDFMQLGFRNTTQVSGNSNDRTSNFAIGAGLNDIATLGQITIGAIYKF